MEAAGDSVNLISRTWRSTLGRKYVMALSGAVLILFLPDTSKQELGEHVLVRGDQLFLVPTKRG